MDFGEFVGGITTVDLLLFLYFLAFVVLGVVQGTIRRLMGVGAILFSFFFAANLATPLGEFLGQYWTQFPKEYSFMVGFLTIFVAAGLAFALVAQGFYKPQPLFPNARFVDEAIGGGLGLIQAGLILAFAVIILGTFFILPGISPSSQELPLLRDIWNGFQDSRIVDFFRDALIPPFFTFTDFLVPDRIQVLFPPG